eukprot:GGOE01006824.1.p1 GENE.GGOE01006824.1~~GGOE01006824.1.p1  ORF type:complete len:202 (+),score=25.83 GGOE01006824.1:111-716(+)
MVNALVVRHHCLPSCRLLFGQVNTGPPRLLEGQLPVRETVGGYVVIIRHGEKDVDLSSNSLNQLGWERSLWLVEWVNRTLPRFTNGTPVTKLLTSIPQPDGLHVRPIQTITPLSIELNLPIQPCPDARCSFDHSVKHLTQRGGTVLVCWQHEDVKDMMALFGFDVPDWSDLDYETVYIIDWAKRSFQRHEEGFARRRRGRR